MQRHLLRCGEGAALAHLPERLRGVALRRPEVCDMDWQSRPDLAGDLVRRLAGQLRHVLWRRELLDAVPHSPAARCAECLSGFTLPAFTHPPPQLLPINCSGQSYCLFDDKRSGVALFLFGELYHPQNGLCAQQLLLEGMDGSYSQSFLVLIHATFPPTTPRKAMSPVAPS
jgi:hypothetical protein